MSIAERLMVLRQAAGQSLQEVADAVGVSKAHVWELEKERSRNPSFDLVRKLAEHFGVTIEELSGASALPDANHQTINRLHRKLVELHPEDLQLVEDMVASIEARRARLAAGE